jgi:multidrug efflux pump subunit AcrA (membrane-fusion protein)
VGTLVASGTLANRAVVPAGDRDHAAAEPLSGFVRPTDVSSIAAPAAVTIADVLVAVGDELEGGQPIAVRDLPESARETAQIDLEVERATHEVAHRERTVAWLQESIGRLAQRAAEAPGELAVVEREAQQVPMRQARDSPERAQIAYEQAALRVRRIEQLAAAGLAAQQDVEQARFEMRLAADDVANAKEAAEVAQRLRAAEAIQAKARRDLTIAEQRRQVAEQQAALEQARLQLKAVQIRSEAARAANADRYIRAPRAGAVIELLVGAGDRLAPGSPVARMARLDPMTVDVDVAPQLVNALHVGDTAEVDVPAASLSRARATIRSIAPVPNEAGRYSVQLTFANPARARLAGQAAEVRFSIRPPSERR